MKFSKRQLSFLLAFVLVIGLFVGAKKILADTGSNGMGYAWSSNIGWIKLNNCDNPDDATTCTGGSYGVTVLPVAPGTVSGYAWSANIGWISFNDPTCPTANVPGCIPGAHVDWTTGEMKGWARACSVYANGCSGALLNDAYLGKWDGYIALDHTSGGDTAGTWGLKVANNKIDGFAWGSDVIGWIKGISSGISSSGLTVGLVADPETIKSGAKSTLTATATNISGASACSIVGDTTGTTIYPITMSQGTGVVWTGTIQVSPTAKTVYTITCTKGGSSATASATVDVTYFNTPPTDPNGPGGPGNTNGGNGGYCAVKNPQFTWNTNAASCTLTRSGGGTQSVAGTSKAAGGTVGTDGLYYFTSNLSVQGTSSLYTLQCGSGADALSITQTVNRCIPDFVLSATPEVQDLAASGKDNMAATFTVTISPFQGFTGPVTLSVASLSPLIPTSAITSFATTTVTDSNGVYPTTQFTITIPTADLKTTLIGAPILLQGVGSGTTRQATVKMGAVVKTKPTYNEF